jgi:pullulanase
MSSRLRIRATIPFVLAFLGSFAARVPAQAPPATVGIPGNYQSESGCAGDWDPACPVTQLAYDANGDVWKNTFRIDPAGGYEYKVALNGTWDVNYGLQALQNGPNIPR